ncbi:FAD-dependent oxidoreductase [Algicella marina]|uniref:Potassium transporter n=1 Tax=Algicella marina TaxID=2683284 RepID=A0A6P1SZZ9_9RHOB|nr:FAD-dependent oxidoreductase [Algicella marina]QHQ34953.1 potassium transporter [Algicella marina]
MTNQATPTPAHYDLCIIGAGLSGMNALFAAAEVLPRDATVVLIDRNERCGGMWIAAYDYVRLHQPHPMFTAGNIPWAWTKAREHLASRDEVISHFGHCLATLRAKVSVTERFGLECVSINETKQSVMVQCRNSANDDETIHATRVIHASGYQITPPAPLSFTCKRILSTTPEHLFEKLGEASSPDVYVIGGGKTGMDTALALFDKAPDKRIHLVNGTGTIFGNRNLYAPKGVKRWWHGKLSLSTFADLALRFDGRNARDVFTYFRQHFTVGPDSNAQQFFFGLLSEEENARLSAGLTSMIGDYLEDVVECGGTPHLLLRSGRRVAIAPGSTIVNCTGHILRKDLQYRPYISAEGKVLTISPRSMVHFLSSVSAYFLTHLFLRNRLPDRHLYALDMQSLLRSSRQDWQMTGITLSLLNTLVFAERLPIGVLAKCGLDQDFWFPFPRRLAAMVRLGFRRTQLKAHCRQVLDAVQRRHGIRCAPLAG